LKKSDDLAKQNAAGIKKINPGITGKIKPITPNTERKTPNQKKNSLIIFREDGSTFIKMNITSNSDK
jgi:hypothetical protein